MRGLFAESFISNFTHIIKCYIIKTGSSALMIENRVPGLVPRILLRSLVFFVLAISWLIGTLSDFLSKNGVGVLEGLLESSGESLISDSSGVLGLGSSLTSLGLQGSGSALGSVSLTLGDDLGSLGGPWVQFEHHC